MQGTLQVCHVVDVPEKGNSDPLAPDGFGGKDLEPILDYSIFTLQYCTVLLLQCLVTSRIAPYSGNILRRLQ